MVLEKLGDHMWNIEVGSLAHKSQPEDKHLNIKPETEKNSSRKFRENIFPYTKSPINRSKSQY